MSTFLYDSAFLKLNDGTWEWTDLEVRMALLDANYFAEKSHTSLVDIPVNSVVLRDVEMTHLRDVGALAKGILPTQESFLSGQEVIAMLLYTRGDTDADAKLIYYSSDGLGFPFTPQGFDYGFAYKQELGGFFEL